MSIGRKGRLNRVTKVRDESMGDPHDQDLKETPLFARHTALGGRMVPFGGYALPVQYPSGIITEHRWTREHAGLFDVSHMGPAMVRLTAPGGDPEVDHRAISALVEPLVSADLQGLVPGQMRYGVLLDDTGGIIDDLMSARLPGHADAGSLYLVVNAGTKDHDFALISAALGDAARLERLDADHALLALQGPEAADALAGIIPDATDLTFMSSGWFTWRDTELVVSRSGYTGEDGFEVLVPAGHAEALWDALLADERVRPIGLGARDSLRLEAGLPLYGHDLDRTTSPIEAGLGFAVSKRRRDAADFPGAARILAERDGALNRIRVGLVVSGAPAREGADILDDQDNVIGTVTSGGFSPTLERAIALGFVPPGQASPGTRLRVSVRGRQQDAEIVATPFVPHRYVRKPANSAAKPPRTA
jgi:aminomethyltransferase